MLDRLTAMGRGLVAMLPQIAVAILVLAATWLLAKVVARVVRRFTRRSSLRPSLIELLQNVAALLVWLAGILIAATIAFPEMSPTDLLAALGIGSVAIGFAFKDVFENFLAGILILYREPMRLRDYICCQDVEGQVEKITIRDTHVRQTDGQLVVLPNAFLFKNPVVIRTDRDERRVEITAGVAYGEDVDRCRDEVVAAIKRALDDAGIEIPFPYRTLTFKEPLEVLRRASAMEDHDERPHS